jgi:DNA gyrase/topoisomerase IV subunit B
MSYEGKDIVTLSQGRAFREKIGMYLSGDRQEAINLGLRELIVNTQDEYEVYKPKNPFLKITIDTTNRVISVEDNMRGIPVAVRDDGMNSLTAAMLINHSGGKHAGTAYESSVGINGCGNKIVNHTAKWLEVEVHRDGKIYTQRFESDDEGAHEVTGVIARKGDASTGTKITYCPDEKVYGEYFIELDKLHQMLRELSYFSKGLKISLIVDNGLEEIFQSQNGLIDGLNNKEAISKPFHYEYKTDDCEVELALQWVKRRGKIRGYANGLYMPDGGAFISGFKSSLTRTFNSLANSKFDGDTIRNLLDGFVSVKVKVGQFSNQAKTALANPEARSATSTAITEALKQFAVEHRSELDAVIATIERLEKADAAAEKARNAILNMEKKETEQRKRKVTSSDKYKDCEKHGQDSMLIICEGNSALGGLMPARDVKTEALYAVRGKVKNLMKHPLDECLENQEVSDIIMALGCGIQDRYNSKKLNYGKVAIAVDADVDGYNIMCLITTLFYVLMPKFIEEGRLGWLRAPLYRLSKGKQHVYAYDDDELAELRKTHAGWEQSRYKGLGEMRAEDMEESMLHPKNRRLDILTIGDAEAAADCLQMLMGTEVEGRRDFLFENVDFSILNN